MVLYSSDETGKHNGLKIRRLYSHVGSTPTSSTELLNKHSLNRNIAKSGIAPALGAGDHKFESCYSDQL